jgi:hypothetical protein
VRILSLTQPWASLWVAGEKRNETRSWRAPYRGLVAVHATKAFPIECVELCYRTPFAEALARLGFNKPDDLPGGAILGWVYVSNIIQVRSRRRRVETAHAPADLLLNEGDPTLERVISTKEEAFGDYSHGRYFWETNDVRRVLPTPLPYRGGQGLRFLPDEIAGLLR